MSSDEADVPHLEKIDQLMVSLEGKEKIEVNQ